MLSKITVRVRCKTFRNEMASRLFPFFIFSFILLTVFSLISLDMDLVSVEESVNQIKDHLTANYISAGNIDEALSALLSVSSTHERDGSDGNNLKGLLYSDSESSNAVKTRLLHAISKLEKKIEDNTARDLYVVSRKAGIVYFFNKNEYASINKEAYPLILSKDTRSGITNDRISEIISWGLQKTSNNVTDMYADHARHGTVYSISYPVYDFTDMSIIGYIFMDNFMSDLTDVVNQTLSSPKPWLGLSLLHTMTGSSTCFYGHCGSSFYQKKSNVSDAYQIIVNIDFKNFILQSKGFYYSLLLSLLMSLIWLIVVANRATNFKLINMTDPLSGLKNRDIIRKINPKNDSAVIVFDCNKFKQINDNYGHDTGDMAIVRISDIIKGNIRGGDIAIRYGGDEFLIYLDSEGEYAQKIAGRIADEIKESPLVVGDDIIYLSVSFGVACIKGDITEAISEADKRMFMNKRSRR